MTLFRNKYRIESSRLQKWDYSSPGFYFITICTHDRLCLFGDIVDSKMEMNLFGKIVNDEWLKSFGIRQEIKRDEFIVMPNHFHAIVGIADTDDSVETHGRASLQQTNAGIAYRPPKSISSLMAGYKSVVTKRINELRESPGSNVWQSRFYDHIIRDDRELFAIRQYIKNNPANWANDRNVLESGDANSLESSHLQFLETLCAIPP